MPPTSLPNITCIRKLHGCCASLARASRHYHFGHILAAEDASNRFLIGESELKAATAICSDHFALYHSLFDELTRSNVLVAGWSISEEYLKDCIDSNCRAAIKAQARPTDVLTCVGLSVDPGHSWLAGLFNRSEAQVMALVEADATEWTTNRLFQWIWALYATDRLIAAVDDPERTHLNDLLSGLESDPRNSTPLIEFLNHMVPEWVRLCWREDLVPFTVNGKPGDGSKLLLEGIEEEVPLWFPARDFSDLRAAAALLCGLKTHGKLSQFDYSTCPGTFKCREDLVILMPYSNSKSSCSLRADTPRKKRLQEACNHALRVKLCVVPMSTADVVTNTVKAMMRDRITDALNLARFRAPNFIPVISLEEFLNA
jgi:hypothetical protein